MGAVHAASFLALDGRLSYDYVDEYAVSTELNALEESIDNRRASRPERGRIAKAKRCE